MRRKDKRNLIQLGIMGFVLLVLLIMHGFLKTLT